MIKVYIAQAQPTPPNLPNATVTFDPWLAVWITLASGLTAILTTFIPQLIKERSDAKIKEDHQESNAQMIKDQAQTNADISGALTKSNVMKQEKEAEIDRNAALSTTVSDLAKSGIEAAKDNTNQVLGMLRDSMDSQKMAVESAILHQKATQNIAIANNLLSEAMANLSLAVTKSNQDTEKTQQFSAESFYALSEGQDKISDDIAGAKTVVIAKLDTIIQQQHDIDRSISQVRQDILTAISSLPG